MLLIWYHISVLAGPDVKNAAKNNGGDKREVSRQKRILVIILWLLWSSIDAYDDRAHRGRGFLNFSQLGLKAV